MKVKNNNTKKVYENATKAAKSCGGCPSHILKVCRGERNSHKGFSWSFASFEKTDAKVTNHTKKGNRVLVISDTQFPFCHPDYLQFITYVYDKFKCDRVLHIGDLADNYHNSRFMKDPEMYSQTSEIEKTMKEMQKLYKTFESMDIVCGNHDLRLFEQTGIHPHFFKSLGEMWEAPESYTFGYQFIIDGVMYTHGDFTTGGSLVPALNHAKDIGMSVVEGHRPQFCISYHEPKFRDYTNSPKLFGMNVGCLMDRRGMGAKYARKYTKEIPLGCGVVIDGTPYLVPMYTNPVNDRWDKKKELF